VEQCTVHCVGVCSGKVGSVVGVPALPHFVHLRHSSLLQNTTFVMNVAFQLQPIIAGSGNNFTAALVRGVTPALVERGGEGTLVSWKRIGWGV
jgi:hypothetical protein